MASYETEVAFVGRFLGACTHDQKLAWRSLEIVKPGMIEHPELEERFGWYSGRFAAGEPALDPDDPNDAIDDQVEAEQHTVNLTRSAAGLLESAERIRTNWRAREQLRLLDLGRIEADKAISCPNGKAKKVAERLSMALLQLFADGSDSKRPTCLTEILEAERQLMDAPEEYGVTLPYPKLEAACGPWIPGDVIAMPGYSGSGKSIAAGNLTLGWMHRLQPVLAFPTEMRERWISRMLAAESRIRQWIAEKRQWKRAGFDEKADYEKAREWLLRKPLEVVNRSNVTPAEIIAATRVLRKRWSGQTVVVIVDHMHRLNYEGEDPNKAVGPATKLLKDFASDDADGGLVMLLLFQPRKPQVDTYRPIAAYEIRGDSMVWNEIDACVSPFRAWVKTDPMRRTPWGTPGTLYESDGRPKLAKPNTDGAKLCDDHVFVKIDKRRVGGEGPTIVLNYHGPSGNIFEQEGAPG